MEVPVSKLRAELSSWIERVRAGEEVVITDRGVAVARLTPPEGHDWLAKLVAEGVVTPPRVNRPRSDPSKWEKIAPTPGPPISDYVSEQRR